MLTARGEPADRIAGLELGADDYLPKPFEPRELLLRVKRPAAPRRAAGTRPRMPRCRWATALFDPAARAADAARASRSS